MQTQRGRARDRVRLAVARRARAPPRLAATDAQVDLLGKAISFLLVIGLVALGAFMLMRGGSGAPSAGEEAEEGKEPAVSEVQVEVPRLSPPAAFNYKDHIVPIEISECFNGRGRSRQGSLVAMP